MTDTFICPTFSARLIYTTTNVGTSSMLPTVPIATRAEFLGLSLFQKIHLNETRPLIQNCMPKIVPPTHNNTRSNDIKLYQSFPPLGAQFSNSYFPHFTKVWNKLETPIKNELFQVILNAIFLTQCHLALYC